MDEYQKAIDDYTVLINRNPADEDPFHSFECFFQYPKGQHPNAYLRNWLPHDLLKGSQKHHDGTCGVDRPNQGDGQMLHAEIAQKPAAEHNAGLEENIALDFPPSKWNLRYKRQEDNGAEERIQEQYRDDGIASKRMLLEYVIAPKECCTEKSK